MRKGMYVVLTAALCLTLAVQASADLTARPWVGAAIGLNFPENTDLVFQAPPLKGVLGSAGLANGAWFGASAGLDLDGPLPFGLFGLMLDFTYNNLNFPAQTFSGGILPSSVASLTVPAMDGHQLSLDLLVRLRMPRLLDRLEPYAALGPGIVWTTVDFAPVGGSRQTSTDWALVAEAGLKVFLIANTA